ncbi:hypothetical protein BH24DEI2_BH24DEI2_10490 [soil metagenome]
MKSSKVQTIEALRKEEERLKIKLRKLKAQQTAAERRDATRRKILIGSALLNAVDAGEVSEAFLGGLLNRYITRKRERAFLGLEPEGAE